MSCVDYLLILVWAFSFMYLVEFSNVEFDPTEKTVAVIGAGFSGLSSACYLRKMGYNVIVVEKNEIAGGRANIFERDGFTFDMGPSWYWMPKIFTDFYDEFGYEPKYKLARLDPSYMVYWDRFDKTKNTALPHEIEERLQLFESLETNSTERVQEYLKESKWKYDVSINEYKVVERPGNSIFEMWDVPFRVPKVHLLITELIYTQREYVAQFVSHPWCRVLLEWPVLFLGAEPAGIPKIYSLMSWADWGLGTWYPLPGGMYAIVDAMKDVADMIGVQFKFNSEITKINIDNSGYVTSLETINNETVVVDAVVNSADYEFVEQNLLPPKYRRYGPEMWDNQVFAPACYLYYLGFDRKIPDIDHHTFFFHEDLDAHLAEVYQSHTWPEDPVFYANVPSKTDPDSAPEGYEAVFILLPVSPNLHTEDSPERREHYLNHVLNRMEDVLQVDLRSHLVMNESFAHKDFQETYHAYKGNAFGLANIRSQTAFLKPKMKSLVSNLIFVGQLTNPGPGVPPSIISGRIGARLINDVLAPGFWTTIVLPIFMAFYMICISVYMTLTFMLSDEQECYEICRRLHMSHGLSFYVSTLLLPRKVRKHVFALYGLTRTADEIVDDMTRSQQQMIDELQEFETDFFDALLNNQVAKHQVNRAAVLTAKELNLDAKMFVRFFKAMRMDVEKPLRFKTMDNLMEYMDGSAAVIGELMLPVLVGKEFYINPEKFPEHKDLIRTARAMGKAFQLTNFCRDVDEDLDRDRLYLPLDILDKHKVSIRSVTEKKMTPQMADAVEECLVKCDNMYKEGREGIKLLAKYNVVASDCMSAAHDLYGGISSKIRAKNHDVFSGRCRVPMKQKVKSLLPHLKFILIPYILELLCHHIYLRLSGTPPMRPPPAKPVDNGEKMMVSMKKKRA